MAQTTPVAACRADNGIPEGQDHYFTSANTSSAAARSYDVLKWVQEPADADAAPKLNSHIWTTPTVSLATTLATCISSDFAAGGMCPVQGEAIHTL